jgi:hypothetical protein
MMQTAVKMTHGRSDLRLLLTASGAVLLKVVALLLLA